MDNGLRDVFISYKSEEYALASGLRARLEKAGVTCWIAPDCIQGGSSYARQIPAAIKSCRALLLVLSKRSMESIWVAREVDRAINEGKRVLPFVVEELELTDEYKFYLTNVQQYYAYKDFDGECERLINDLLALSGKERRAETPAPPFAETAPTAKAEEASKTSADESSLSNEDALASFSAGRAVKDLKPPKREKDPAAKKRLRKLLIPLAIGLACAAAAVIIAVATTRPRTGEAGNSGSSPRATSAPSKVTIDGKVFASSIYGISLNGASLSQEDVESFRAFSQLAAIELTDCTLPADISALFGKELTRLELINCGLTSEQLASVSLEGSRIQRLALTDAEGFDPALLSPVAKQLTSVDLSRTGVTFETLPAMPELEKLVLNGNGIKELPDLSASFPSLTALGLDDNELTSISKIGSLVNLTELRVSRNKLVTLNGLETCIRLEKLFARENAIAEITGLTNATVLSKVDLGGNPISDITLLGKSAAKLTHLWLDGCEIEDISVLRDMTGLRYLDLSRNRITSISPIFSLGKLVGLSLAGNPLDRCGIFNGDMSADSLEYLDLSDTALNLYLPLRTVMNSEVSVTVNLSGCNFALDFSLSGVNYKFICIAGLEVSSYEYDKLALTKGTVLLMDYLEGFDYPGLKSASFYKIYIVGCPLDKQLSLEDTLGKYTVEFISGSDISKHLPDPASWLGKE